MLGTHILYLTDRYWGIQMYLTRKWKKAIHGLGDDRIERPTEPLCLFDIARMMDDYQSKSPTVSFCVMVKGNLQVSLRSNHAPFVCPPYRQGVYRLPVSSQVGQPAKE